MDTYRDADSYTDTLFVVNTDRAIFIHRSHTQTLQFITIRTKRKPWTSRHMVITNRVYKVGSQTNPKATHKDIYIL